MIGNNKIAGIFEKKPFYKQYYFVGSLETKKGKKLSKLNIYIEFKEGEPSKITGSIIGDPNNAFGELESMMGEYCILRSDSSRQISSEKVLIRSISRNMSNLNCQAIANLSLQEVKITSNFECDKPNLRIFYEGMESFRTHESSTYRLDGTINVRKNIRKKYFQEFKTANIEFENNHFYLHQNNVLRSFFAKTVLFLFKADIYQKKNIVNECMEFFNDILLIASFLENNENQLFAYELFNGKERVLYYKSSKPKQKTTDIDDFLITRAFTEKFIEDTLPRFIELRKRGIDLKIPFNYLITGSIAPNVHIAYVNYFTALEKIKDMYAKSKKPPIDFVCDGERQQELTEEILPILESKLGKIYNKNSFEAKLKVVYRNSISKIVKKIIKEYCVDLKDLFPKGKVNLQTIIDIRAELIHSSSEVDVESLILNEIRLKAIVQRIIIKMLGWNETNQVPNHFLRAILKENKIDFL